jgi:alkylation response protein AidB-like acyl-CoA dehydrogenase
MRLDFDDERRLLAKALRAELGRIGEGVDGAAANTKLVHDCLSRLGIFAVEVPADREGLALGLGHGVVVCEELGRAAANDDYRAGALLAEVLADGAGSRHFAAGAATAVAAAWTAPVRISDHGLTGRAVVCDSLSDASYLVLPASEGGGRRLLAAVPLPADGITVQESRGGVRTLVLERVRPAGAVPAADGDGVPTRTTSRAWLRQASYLMGLAAGAHRLAVGRAWHRIQFGQPVGVQQAIAFPLARQFARLQAARLLVHRAVWLDDRGLDAAFAAAGALAYAAELGLEVTGWAVHVHGAFGLTRHSLVHRFYQRAATEALWWGKPTTLWRLVATQLEQGDDHV